MGGTTMIEESYVSFNTAKMLKEAGFDIPCREIYRAYRMGNYVFRKYDRKNTKDDLCWNSDDGFQYEYLAPTQALAERWLREVYGIMIVSFFDDYMSKWYYVIDGVKKQSVIKCVQSASDYDDYETALDNGLQEAIKLIKK